VAWASFAAGVEEIFLRGCSAGVCRWRSWSGCKLSLWAKAFGATKLWPRDSLFLAESSKRRFLGIHGGCKAAEEQELGSALLGLFGGALLGGLAAGLSSLSPTWEVLQGRPEWRQRRACTAWHGTARCREGGSRPNPARGETCSLFPPRHCLLLTEHLSRPHSAKCHWAAWAKAAPSPPRVPAPRSPSVSPVPSLPQVALGKALASSLSPFPLCEGFLCSN